MHEAFFSYGDSLWSQLGVGKRGTVASLLSRGNDSEFHLEHYLLFHKAL